MKFPELERDSIGNILVMDLVNDCLSKGIDPKIIDKKIETEQGIRELCELSEEY